VEEARDGERKGAAKGFIAPAREMRRRDLELSLWRDAVVAGDEDDEEDHARRSVETIGYFSMARVLLMSLFDTSRLAHDRRLSRGKVSRRLWELFRILRALSDDAEFASRAASLAARPNGELAQSSERKDHLRFLESYVASRALIASRETRQPRRIRVRRVCLRDRKRRGLCRFPSSETARQKGSERKRERMPQ